MTLEEWIRYTLPLLPECETGRLSDALAKAMRNERAEIVRMLYGDAAGDILDVMQRATFLKPKKVTSWRVCPECGGRATKLFNLSADDKPLSCQQCGHHYNPPGMLDGTLTIDQRSWEWNKGLYGERFGE